MLLFKLFLKAIGKGLSSKYILSRHRREVHKEKVMTETEKKIKKMQEKNKNCKTPLHEDEENAEPLKRKHFFV